MGTKSCFSATDRTLITSWPDLSGRPDRWSHDPLIRRCQRPVTCHRTRPVAFSPLWNLSVLDRTLLSCVRSICRQRPVTATAEPLDRGVRSLCYQRPVTSVSSFLRDLASGLVPIFVLGLCLISWVFSYASSVLLMVLIIGSSRCLRPSDVLHPIELQNNHLQIH